MHGLVSVICALFLFFFSLFELILYFSDVSGKHFELHLCKKTSAFQIKLNWSIDWNWGHPAGDSVRLQDVTQLHQKPKARKCRIHVFPALALCAPWLVKYPGIFTPSYFYKRQFSTAPVLPEVRLWDFLLSGRQLNLELSADNCELNHQIEIFFFFLSHCARGKYHSKANQSKYDHTAVLFGSNRKKEEKHFNHARTHFTAVISLSFSLDSFGCISWYGGYKPNTRSHWSIF